MRSTGMPISQLIALLQAEQAQHGDVEVFAGGEDYPGGVSGVGFVPAGRGNGYVPENSVKIYVG
jgi:hypothetical protein